MSFYFLILYEVIQKNLYSLSLSLSSFEEIPFGTSEKIKGNLWIIVLELWACDKFFVFALSLLSLFFFGLIFFEYSSCCLQNYDTCLIIINQ